MGTVAPEQVWEDCDKRNTGRRLVRVVRLFYRDGRRYAACITITTGGRPFTGFTKHPEKVGSGSVGDETIIRVDRLLTPRFYKLVFDPNATPSAETPPP